MRMYKKLITLILVLTMVLSQGVLTPLAAEQSIYSEEIEVIKALGIMVGDENGDFGAQNNLTRAEFANVLTVLLQINDSETAKENAWYFKAGEELKNQVFDSEKVQRFTDVPADHWAYGVIEQVTSIGYMIGTSATEFSPEENVTINQVNKVLVKMLGYEVFAERNGGYPAGYNYTASSIKLLKGINHYGETPILRGELAKMLVNMFEVEMIEVGYVTDGGTTTYQQSDKTFLEDSLKIFTAEGELTNTSVTGLYGESGIADGEVVIGGVVYKVAEGAEYINGFLGKVIEIYYVKDINGRNVVLYAALSDETDEFVIDIKDFISLTNGELKYNEDDDEEKLDLISMPAIIFNGTAVDTISTEQIKAFYNGTITAINSDDRGEYDMLVIEAYRTMFVKNFADDTVVNGLLIQGKDKDAVLNLDKKDNKDTVINYYKDNLPASASDIARNSVIDVAVSKGEIKVIITKDTKNITVAAISDDVDGYFIYDAEGNAYKIADDYFEATKNEEKDDNEEEDITAVKLPMIGANCTLYFNSFGEVAYAEISSAEYPNTGLIIKSSEDGRGLKKGVKVKIFSNTGRFTEYDLAEKVIFIDSKNKENKYKVTDEKVLPILAALENKLVTYKLDEDKKISGIKEPVNLEDGQGREKGRLGVIYEEKGEATYRGNNLGFSAYITGNTTIFSISSNVGISEEEKYQIFTKKELDTLSEAKFASAIAYNTDKNTPDAEILIAKDMPLTTFKLSDTNTPLYMVDKVMQSVNADGEPTVMLEGTYLSGGQTPAGVTKKYVSATGAFSNMRALVGLDKETKYTVQKGDVITCLEVNGDVKFAALVYRRTLNYPANSRYEGGALLGVNSGIYNNTTNSNPYNPSNGTAIDVNGYNIYLPNFGSSNLNPTSWRVYDMFAISANEKYITLTTQDLSEPGSIPEYDNPAYTVISIPVPTNISRQVKKGDNYSSGPIYFTGIKTYETSLNDCSRALVVTNVQRAYKLVILDEE